MLRPFYKTKRLLSVLCDERNKPMPTLDGLEKLFDSLGYQYPFYPEDWPAASGPNRGPFTDAMAIAIQAHLGFNPMGLDVLQHAVAVPEHLQRSRSGVDFFGHWADMLEEFLNLGFRLSGNPLVAKPNHLETAARDIDIAYGYQLEEQKNPASPLLKNNEANKDELRVKGCNAYPVGNTTYFDLLRRWWTQNRWTVLRACRGNTSVGWAVLLPVTRDLYEAIKRGKIALWEIQAKDILSKSTYFFVEAGFERPFIECEERSRMARAVAASFLAQLAISVPPGRENQLYGLSFDACEVGATRLARAGYRHIPERMKGSGFQLMEFSPQTPRIQRMKMAEAIRHSRRANRKLLQQ